MPRISQPINVIKLTNVSLVRYRDGANVFEVACYPNKVRDWREGQECDINEVLQSDRIFSCVGKGQFARDAELMGSFGTTDFTTCVRKILKEGTIQLCSKERKLLEENFQKEVYNLTASRIGPLQGDFQLNPQHVEDFVKRAHLIPRQKRGVPPKPCAAILANKLVKSFPKELGILADRIKLVFGPNDQTKRQACTEVLKNIDSYAPYTDPDSPSQVNTNPSEKLHSLQSVPDIDCWIHASELPSLEAYCAANGITLKILGRAIAVPYDRLPSKRVGGPVIAGVKTLEKDGNAPAHSKSSEDSSESLEDDASDEPAVTSNIVLDTRYNEQRMFLALASSDEESAEITSAKVTDRAIKSAPMTKAPSPVSSSDESNFADMLLLDHKAQQQRHKMKEKKIRERERKARELAKEAVARALAVAPTPTPPAKLCDATQEEMASPSWCKACNIDFVKTLNQTIRQHVKMDLHVFNQKRHIRGQPGVSREVFADLSNDLKEGFLAIDS